MVKTIGYVCSRVIYIIDRIERKIAIEKQSGNACIQKGNSPLTYAIYRRLNELLLLKII